MKICSKCGVEKHESEFKKDKREKQGIANSCKICYNKSQVGYNHSEHRKKYMREYMFVYDKTELRQNYIKEHKPTVDIARKRGLKMRLKKQLGFEPPEILIEVKTLINKTRKLCKTSKNLETT